MKIAAQKRDRELLTKTLAELKSLDPNDPTVCEAFVRVVALGDLAMVDRFLELGADIDCRYKSYTPLSTAAKHCNARLVRALVDRGADVHRHADVEGFGIHLACREIISSFMEDFACKQYVEIVRLLLELGSSPNYANSGEANSLELACEAIYPPMVELLLQFGATINLARDGGREALRPAALDESANADETLKLLVGMGVNINVAVEKKLNALDVALKRKWRERIQLLRSMGALTSEELASEPDKGKLASAGAKPTANAALGSTPLDGNYTVDIPGSAKVQSAMMHGGRSEASFVESLSRNARELSATRMAIADGALILTSTEDGDVKEESMFIESVADEGDAVRLIIRWHEHPVVFRVVQLAGDVFHFQNEANSISEWAWRREGKRTS